MTTGREVGVDVDELLATFSEVERARNGVPDSRTGFLRLRCQNLLRDTFGALVVPGSLRWSPLGPEWTEVFEATLTAPVDAAVVPAEWLPLDRLLPALPADPSILGTWAVVEDGHVLAGVRLRRGASARSEVDELLERCRARRQVRLRDVLELCAFRRAGAAMPLSSPVLAAAADVESGLGGRLLAPWATGRAAYAPVALPTIGPRRRPRLVVAISGVDGSGKTTLRTAVEAELRRAGVLVTTVWVRPGMGLGPLVLLASWAKRTLGQAPTAGVRTMGEGGAEAAGLRSRRGLVGWAWAMLVCSSFIGGVWRQHLRADGVVLYDRHLLDALATLDFVYDGVDLRVQHTMVRALLPRAQVSLYLDVPVDVSLSRKPDDVFGATAVTRQLAAYAHWLQWLPASHSFDATRPAAELVQSVLQLLTSKDRPLSTGGAAADSDRRSSPVSAEDPAQHGDP